MFYSVDLLHFRKNTQKQPLQICWCAATTKNFVGTDSNKVSKEEVNAVEIAALCDDIVRGFLGANDNIPRFSLYLSSQLIFGTLKIFQRQVFSLEEISHVLYAKIVFDSASTGRKNIKQSSKQSNVIVKENAYNSYGNIMFSLDQELRLPSLPEIDIAKVFEGVEFSQDTHLIKEADFARDQMELSFGFNKEGSNTELDMSKQYPAVIRQEENMEMAICMFFQRFLYSYTEKSPGEPLTL